MTLSDTPNVHRENHIDADKKYYQENKEKIKARSKEYRKANKEKLKHYHKEYRLKNKEKYTLRHKLYNEIHRERIKSLQKQYYLDNKEKIRRLQMKYLYGLSFEDYNLMVKEQNSKCAICLKTETKYLNGKLVSLGIDHNHVTGKVRGLLCRKCNTVIGALEENIDTMKRMIDYIEKWK